MNTLFYRYGSICEPDIIDALMEYGINVIGETVEVNNKNITAAQKADIVSKRLFEREYAFVFSVNYFPEISSVCNIFKIPYISLIVDSPIIELYSDTISNSCNRIFLFDSELYREFAPQNPDGIFYIPLASNTKRWDKIIEIGTGDFHSDISFVGSLYTEKCRYNKLSFPSDRVKGYIDGIIESQLKVYGYFFIEELLTDQLVRDILAGSDDLAEFAECYKDYYRQIIAQLYLGTQVTVRERFELFKRISEKYNVDIYTGSDTGNLPKLNNRGMAKTHTEMPLIFNQSKININPTAKSIRAGIPLRVFDVLGCGGFLITNHQNDLADCFTAGEHLAVYDSLDCLDELLRYYLEHPKERMEIARNGYEHVKKYHTYTIRIGQIISKVFSKE